MSNPAPKYALICGGGRKGSGCGRVVQLSARVPRACDPIDAAGKWWADGSPVKPTDPTLCPHCHRDLLDILTTAGFQSHYVPIAESAEAEACHRRYLEGLEWHGG
jgi:hypothetical protein